MNAIPKPGQVRPSQISDQERAQRKAAVDYARGSVRLEGFVLSPAVEEINQRYIDGKLTGAELVEAIKAAVSHE